MRTFEGKVIHYIQELKMIEHGDRVLVAVSGGIDSMALLHFLYKYRSQLGIEVFAVHVDHMLRGEQSEGDRYFVETFCRERGIPVFSMAIPIPTILAEEMGNLQAVCRRERYRYFKEIMTTQNIHKLVTAHHADDQLESVLMALTKGAIMKGIQGIRAIRTFAEAGVVVRPFLTVPKNEIKRYLVAQGLSYREDASNAKDDYMRNRFRHHVLPLLTMENESVSEHAVHLTRHLQEDADYLMGQAESIFSNVVFKSSENTYSMEINAFQKVPLALQKRIILILLNYLYQNSNTTQSYALWTSILKLCETTNGSAEIHLPEGFKAVRTYNQVAIFQSKDIEENILIGEVPLAQWTDLGNGTRIYIGQCTETFDNQRSDNMQVYFFSSHELTLPLFIRERQDGDRISLKGMNKPKRLSRLFIDEKIPSNLRDSIPVLTSKDHEVVAVIGVRISKYFSIEKQMKDDMVLIISYASLK